jgi:hypothetical protein
VVRQANEVGLLVVLAARDAGATEEFLGTLLRLLQ